MAKLTDAIGEQRTIRGGKIEWYMLRDKQVREICEAGLPKGFMWQGSMVDVSRLWLAAVERAQKAEKELLPYLNRLRDQHRQLSDLTAERDDLKSMLADAGIRNAVLTKRLSKLLGMYADMALGQCDEDCDLMGDDVMANISQCKSCLRDEAIKRLEQEVRL